jgi:hypothetical protein
MAKVVEAINALPVQNVRAELPLADPSLASGTPKGAAAAIVRERYQQLHDEVLNRLSPDDQHVPALRLVVQEDAYQRGAVLIDLAAPETATLRSVSPCRFCGTTGGSTIDPPLPVLPSILSPLRPEGSGPFVPAPTTHGSGGRGHGSGLLDKILGPAGRGARAVANGLIAMLTSPHKLPLVIAVWSVLATPVYLSARRRLLLLDDQQGDL